MEEIDFDEEGPMVADHMERENHMERDQDIQPADRVQTHCMRLQENHDEINQATEIDKDLLVFDEAVQLGRLDQAPLLADQDQIGRNTTPQFFVQAHCMRLRSSETIMVWDNN